MPPYSDPLVDDSAFIRCRWFMRGWTLQVLIAPTSLYFYTAQWNCIRTKESLSDKIASITGIHGAILRGGDYRTASVARRMSWASHRTITRKEDIAYCLLGIFGVNMAMLYGEGERAFVRLQEEIIKESNDQSLFAWGTTLYEFESSSDFTGVLAKSPSEFATSGPVIRSAFLPPSSPHTITSEGLRIELPIYPFHDEGPYGVLNCHYENGLLHVLAIPLVRIGPDEFARVQSRGGQIGAMPQHLCHLASMEKVYIKKDVLQVVPAIESREHGFLLKLRPFQGDMLGGPAYQLSAVYPHDTWNSINQTIFQLPDSYDLVRHRAYRHALLLFQKEDEHNIVIRVGSQESISSSLACRILNKLHLDLGLIILGALAMVPLLMLDIYWPVPFIEIEYERGLVYLLSLLVDRFDELLLTAVTNVL